MKRFWSKVAVDDVHLCWEWQASDDGRRYGKFRLDGRMQYAHIVAYELTFGSYDSELELDHLCRNTKCVNPYHLEPVSHQENMKRTRKPTCKRGHVSTRNKRGTCHECERLRAIKVRERQREKIVLL